MLLSPATGVKQHFYLRFVNWLVAQGHDVLVFDYRGIGLSRQGHLKHNKATLADWGQQDQVAALNRLLQRTGREQVLMLGHSTGGQMIGLPPNHRRVARPVARVGFYQLVPRHAPGLWAQGQPGPALPGSAPRTRHCGR